MSEDQEKLDKRIGNQFWKLRSTHGREKIFDSPDAMWEAACEYFQWCTDNPIISVEQRKSSGKGITIVIADDDDESPLERSDLIQLPLMRPFTWEGIAMFMDCDVKTLRDYCTEESHKDFHPIHTRIREVIYRQKFEGAAVGLLNHSIIARDLGLIDRRQQETHEVDQPLFDNID